VAADGRELNPRRPTGRAVSDAAQPSSTPQRCLRWRGGRQRRRLVGVDRPHQLAKDDRVEPQPHRVQRGLLHAVVGRQPHHHPLDAVTPQLLQRRRGLLPGDRIAVPEVRIAVLASLPLADDLAGDLQVRVQPGTPGVLDAMLGPDAPARLDVRRLGGIPVLGLGDQGARRQRPPELAVCQRHDPLTPGRRRRCPWGRRSRFAPRRRLAPSTGAVDVHTALLGSCRPNHAPAGRRGPRDLAVGVRIPRDAPQSRGQTGGADRFACLGSQVRAHGSLLAMWYLA
jgi:hypothetical protein